MAHEDLRFLIASILFGGATAPPSLYLGLTLDSEVTGLTLADVGRRELVAPGYRRVELPRDAWAITRYPPRTAASASIVNRGSEVWPPARGAFLATSQDNSGLLVAFTPFVGGGRIAYPGDTIMFPIEVEF